jgi:hypothetical protein
MTGHKDFITGAICFCSNLAVTTLALSIPKISDFQGVIITATQLALVAATWRCWTPTTRQQCDANPGCTHSK